MTLLTPAFLQPLFALLGVGLGVGALLGVVARRCRVDTDPVIDRINDLLPQTQCGQCGYPGCKPYAEAIAAGDAINKCPPGGDKTIAELADLLNVRVIPLDVSHGQAEIRKVAYIREDECIGCAKCIPACPVDAILGANKFMHTVIASECTGCDLCVEPCPVDCIDMVPAQPQEPPAAMPAFTAADSLACINCGLCIDQCPVDILPHELYRACRLDDLDRAAALKLAHCIECSKCDKVCPPGLPLTATYRRTKQAMAMDSEEKRRAEQAKWRFEAHQRRLQKLEAEEETRRNKRAELAQRNRRQVSADGIQAALARVKAKRDSRE